MTDAPHAPSHAPEQATADHVGGGYQHEQSEHGHAGGHEHHCVGLSRMNEQATHFARRGQMRIDAEISQKGCTSD
ncbi:hypothetical protein [Acetobacter estunensis]|uniref:hypothetical protein n=1 Tax=Acetobacter estunensis TaxID=104097 RepID=UPI00140D4B83|nr:hypothetical protein [Acetobacter estunensis]